MRVLPHAPVEAHGVAISGIIGPDSQTRGGEEIPIDLLLEEAKGMKDEDIMQVVRFIRFLKYGDKKKCRNAGYFKDSGKGWMADDFDDPLNDQFAHTGETPRCL